MIRIKSSWKRKRVVVHFGGVESAFFLHLNGCAVGFGKGSRTPVEFDLTPYVKAGRNVLAVKVVRWSDGSYLEDQDHWWMAGIFRDVYLCSTEDIYIEDINVTAGTTISAVLPRPRDPAVPGTPISAAARSTHIFGSTGPRSGMPPDRAVWRRSVGVIAARDGNQQAVISDQ